MKALYYLLFIPLLIPTSLSAQTGLTPSNLHYQEGKVFLQNGLAEIQVPKGFKFLDQRQSNYVLTELWGNPADVSTLGMLLPKQGDVLGKGFTYAIEISYKEDGHIVDEGANKIDFYQLMVAMKRDTKQKSKERKKLGYEGIELMGWASVPFYDSYNKKLYWAKELKFEGREQHTLNYNIRILGRKGFLMLNAIGDMDYLPLINQEVSMVLSSVNFTPGNRYEDFNPDTDPLAAYDISGLVAGNIFSKKGFSSFIGRFWPFLLIGLLGASLKYRKRLFRLRTKA